MGDGGHDDREDRAYVVEAQRARLTGPSRGLLATIVIAVAGVVSLSAWGMLVAPGPGPVPTTSPVAVVSSTRPPVPPGPTLALPSADGEGLPSASAANEADAFAALAVSGGWPACPMWRPFSDGFALDAAAIEAALRDVPGPAGMYRVRDAGGAEQRVWVGGTEDDAARGFGGSAIVRVGDAAWTIVPANGRWAAVRVDRVPLRILGADAWTARVTAVPATYCGVSFGGPPPVVVEVPGSADPYARLVVEAGWFVCRTWQRLDDGAGPTAADVDAAAERARSADGPAWLTVTVHGPGADRQLPVWVGDDPAAAGTSHGTTLVVLNGARPHRAWMTASVDGHPMAVAFDVVTTPAGRTAWLPTGSEAGIVGDCTPAPGSPVGGAATPTPSQSTGVGSPIEILRGIPNASALLAQRLGWMGCRMATLEPYPLDVPGDLVDQVVASLGVESGPIGLTLDGATQPTLVFIGTDIVELARLEQVPVVAVDGRPVIWMADETRAREWRASITPAGRTFWVATGAAAWPDGGCVPPPDATPGITGFRSLTCWTDRDRCLKAIEAARTFAPEAFGPAADVAAGLASTCPAGVACPWTGPDDPVTVTVAPDHWRALGELRLFTTGLRRLSGVAVEHAADAASPETLALASRPSIALPESTAVTGTCGPGSLRGALHASPWDPRIAWVGQTPVTWPAGSLALFVPDLRLFAPDGTLVGGPGDEVLLAGAAEGPGAADTFDACEVVSARTAEP
ncbi:MAG TPA: hypothetical protein VGK16_04685 [Candidatus Limnocylindrales bacterium]